MSGGTNTTTSSNAPPPEYTAAYSAVNQQAQNTASVPYQPYPGQTVAGLSPDQLQGITDVESASGLATPYINSAAQDLNNATTPIWNNVQQFSPAAVSQYESPYTSQVVGATEQQFNNQNAIQQAGITGNAISQGAFGGDRSAVAQGITAGQQQANEAPVIAGLENQGYSQALGEFNSQQGAQIGASEANAWLNSQAGAGMANLGQEALGTSLTGANAELGIGGLEQQQAQAGLNVPYEQFLAAQAYPYQSTGWLANIAEGLGGASGGSSSSTSPSNTGSQVAGLGVAGVGVLGGTGAFGSNGYLTNAFGSSTPAAAAVGSEASAGLNYGSFAGTYAASGGRVTRPHQIEGHASGGGITLLAPGGGISGFAAPGSNSPGLAAPGVAIPTGDPNVGISIVPGASGMGSDPATHGTSDILKNYGTTSTSHSSAGVLGGALQGGMTGASLGSSFGPYGAIAGGVIGAVGGGISGAQARGGIVRFPQHRAAGGITANDNWEPEPIQRRATGGYSVSTVPSNHGGPAVPVLSYSGGSGGITGAPTAQATGGGMPQSVQSYLTGQQAGASYAPPLGYVPPPPPPPSQSLGMSAAELQAAINAEAQFSGGSGADGGQGGGATDGGGGGGGTPVKRGGIIPFRRRDQGGIVALDDGGDVPVDPALSNAMLNNESSGRMVPGIVGDNGQAGGPAQVHPGALADVNAHLGTNYSWQQLVDDPALGKKVGDTYLGMMQQRFGSPALALGAYNAGPGAMQHAIDSGAGISGLPASAQDYVARGMRTMGQPQPASGGITGDAGNVGPQGHPGLAGITGPSPEQPATDTAAPASTYSPWRTLMNVGLGIASQKSGLPLANIGAGALEGIQISDKEKQTEAQQAMTRQQNAATNQYRQATQVLENARQAEGARHNVADEQAASGRLGEEQRHNTEVEGQGRSISGYGKDENGNTVPGLIFIPKNGGPSTFQPAQTAEAARQDQRTQALRQTKDWHEQELALRQSGADQATISNTLNNASRMVEMVPGMKLEDAVKQITAQRSAIAPPAHAPSQPLAAQPPSATPAPATGAAQPSAIQPPAIPQMPTGLPGGSLFSPSRQQWRDPAGKLYDATGKPVA